MEDKYNSYGNLKTKVLDNILPGDTVEFGYAKHLKVDGKMVNTIIKLKGIWDGEKVCFKDKDKTIVRTTEWLKLCKDVL